MNSLGTHNFIYNVFCLLAFEDACLTRRLFGDKNFICVNCVLGEGSGFHSTVKASRIIASDGAFPFYCPGFGQLPIANQIDLFNQMSSHYRMLSANNETVKRSFPWFPWNSKNHDVPVEQDHPPVDEESVNWVTLENAISRRRALEAYSSARRVKRRIQPLDDDAEAIEELPPLVSTPPVASMNNGERFCLLAYYTLLCNHVFCLLFYSKPTYLT